jgi:hypothetical protein
MKVALQILALCFISNVFYKDVLAIIVLKQRFFNTNIFTIESPEESDCRSWHLKPLLLDDKGE